MAEIETIISGDVTLKMVIGAPTVNEFEKDIEKYITGNPTKYTIWDLSKGSVANLTSNNILHLVKVWMKTIDGRIERKTVVVAPKEFKYWTGRTASAFVETNGIRYKIRMVRSSSEAAERLGIPKLPRIINSKSNWINVFG